MCKLLVKKYGYNVMEHSQLNPLEFKLELTLSPHLQGYRFEHIN
jgi:hypothetical protein